MRKAVIKIGQMLTAHAEIHWRKGLAWGGALRIISGKNSGRERPEGGKRMFSWAAVEKFLPGGLDTSVKT